MNPDRLAELEEERRFLLRSLADLEQERAAGDVDDHDYATLRDGYTKRAAAVIRSIDEGRAALPPAPPRNWKRIVAGTLVVVAVAVGLGWYVASSSGQRRAGQEITGGDPRDEIQLLLADARALQVDNPGQAAALYAEVVQRDEGNLEALTYFGWTLALSTVSEADAEVAATRREAAEVALRRAIDLDPDYPDPYCFLAIIEFRFNDDAEAASTALDGCEAGNPPADVAGFVASLREQIDAQIAENVAGKADGQLTAED